MRVRKLPCTKTIRTKFATLRRFGYNLLSLAPGWYRATKVGNKFDEETEAVVMCGEIGGTDEEECAAWIKDNMTKPVAGFIAGVTAPPGKRMGHAGAIISGGQGTAQSKIQALREAGVHVTENPSEMGTTLKAALG